METITFLLKEQLSNVAHILCASASLDITRLNATSRQN